MGPHLTEREIFNEYLDESNLQHELTWGISYRTFKEPNKTAPITPKHSPISAPFTLCRTMQRKNKKKKEKHPCSCTVCRCFGAPHMSLLDRSVLPQDKYMELLSTPNPKDIKGKKCFKKEKKLKPCCKCLVEPCPPRLIQMSIPNKRLVLENWKAYQHSLPAEILMRFDQILKSGNNLEPKEARYYFKQLKKKQRKAIRRRKRLLRKKKQALKKGEKLWLKHQIEETAEAIVNYIKNEPLFLLNFQQMMTSNELLTYLANQKVIKIKSRNTKCIYKKTVIDISDKFVKWMDTVSFFADIQPLDSKEQILEMPSLEGLLEEEGEEEEEEEEEEEGEGKRKKKRWEEWGEEMEEVLGEAGFGAGDATLEEFMAEKLLDKTKLFGEEGEGSLLDLLGELDEDILEKLIQILSASPEEFLNEEIDSENLPGITYADILEKLKEIREGNLMEMKRDKVFLEDKMIEWAKNNEPESVDDKVLDKIHETSKILSEWFKNVDIEEFKKSKVKGLGEGERREEGEGGEGGQEGEGAEGGEEDETLKPGTQLGEGEEDETLVPIEEVFEKSQISSQAAAPIPEEEEEGEEFKESLDRVEGEAVEGEAAEGLQEGAGFGGEGDDEEGEAGLYGFEEGEGFGFDEEGYGEEGFGFGEEGLGFEGGAAMGGIGFGMGEGFGELDETLYGEGAEFGGEEFGELFGEEEEGEEEALGEFAEEIERLDSSLGIIRGHKPSVVFEHQPGTICCLSLKTWAAWLLEIATNAHNWTKWISDIIKQVRYYAATIRGDVALPSGETKVLYKEEWRRFVKDAEEKTVSWRQYSKHVKDLSAEIMENFHGKPVTCCPKCLQDHLIKNVVTAHETLLALTEAINCAGYWQRCLNNIVEQTSKMTDIGVTPEASSADVTSLKSEESYTYEIEELLGYPVPPEAAESYGTIYEIEEVMLPQEQISTYEIEEIRPVRLSLSVQEFEEIGDEKHEEKQEPKKQESKTKKQGKKKK